jgi:ribosomal protein S14
MNKNTRNIIKEKIIRINLSKKEILKKILKSIYQNNNINNNIKIYSTHILNKITKKNYFLTKKHKICIYTGKRSGLLKGFNMSRYILKDLILKNRFTNLKKNN